MNKEGIKLEDIYLGVADGRAEAENKDFVNYFYIGNKYYEKLERDSSKFIIAGKKGTGKTLLAKYFEYKQCELGRPTVLLTERDTILNALIETGSISMDLSERDLLTEYILLTAIGRVLYQNKRRIWSTCNLIKFRKIFKSLKYINEVVYKRWNDSNYSFSTYEKEYSSALKGELKSCKKVVDSKVGVNKENKLKTVYSKNNYKNQIDSLKNHICFLLKYININILIDDLDEYKKIISKDSDFIELIISFINVSYRLNSEFPKKRSSSSRIILLLRSDIMSHLNNNSSNLNKILADSQIILNWRKKNQGNTIAPLVDMIATKIKNSSPYFKDKSNKEIIHEMLPDEVNHNKFDVYLRNYTFGKPRDVIFMLNTIKDEFEECEKFEEGFFYKTRYQYAEKLLGELRNEMHIFYTSEKIDEYFNILEGMQKYNFDYADIKEYISENELTIDPKDLCEILYEYGIIGNFWERNNKKKVYTWAFDEESTGKPKFNERFAIHFAIRKNILGNIPISRK